MSCRCFLGYLVASLLILDCVRGAPQTPCTIPKSCSDPQQSSTNATTSMPACRCDARCHLYNDCCYDAPRQRTMTGSQRTETGSQRRVTIGCEFFPVIDKYHEIFVVSRCPESYPDEDTAVNCNNSTIRALSHDRYPRNLSVEYVLQRVPVSSKSTGILYRNAFCAICNGELNFEFWTIRMESTDPISANSNFSSTDLLGVLNGSRVSYGQPSDDLAPRTCIKSYVADCLPGWGRNVTEGEEEEAESVRRECRRYQSYVQVTPTLYRNWQCARCNLISEANASCTDFEQKVLREVIWPDPLPYSVLLDFNSGFWDLYNAPKAISGNPSSRSNDDCEQSKNDTTSNGTDCAKCDLTQNPCSQEATLFPKSAGTTTGDLILSYLTFVGNILSVISLSFLFLTYCCIPSLRNTPGRCLMCLCASLLLAQLLFAAFGNYDNQIPSFDSTPNEESYNETDASAFETLENNTEGSSINQINKTERVRDKSRSLLGDNNQSSMMMNNVDTVPDGDDVDGTKTAESRENRTPVKREVPATSPTQLMSNESQDDPSVAVSPVPKPSSWTFRKDVKSIVCYASSLIGHYFYLAYFCWSNTMAIDVWRTFRTLSSSLPSQADLRRRHFIFYSIYSWSIPAAIVVAAGVTDAVGATVRPLYGVRFCWISNPLGLLVYLYAPCLLVTVANILLFVLSSVNICYASMDDVQSRFGGRGLEGRQRLFLYVRLASVMGVTWASGLLASVTRSTVLWYVFVITTAFQGVYIGLCFMATNQMRKVIREKIKLNYTSSVMTKSTYK